MDGRKVRIILLAVSAASIIVTVAGLFLGFPFLACFLFLPGIIGFGGFGRGGSDDQKGDAGRCPECGSHVDPSDSFCRACGRRL